MNENPPQYGVEDASYQAAGQLEGITRLVDRFYFYMDTLQEAQAIRSMHPSDLTLSREKLTFFLQSCIKLIHLILHGHGVKFDPSSSLTYTVIISR